MPRLSAEKQKDAARRAGRFRMPSALLWAFLAENDFEFRDNGTPAGVPLSHFHNRFFCQTKRTAPGVTGTVLSVQDQAVSSTLFLPASSFCLKRPLALKPGMEVDSSWLDTLVLGLV